MKPGATYLLTPGSGEATARKRRIVDAPKRYYDRAPDKRAAVLELVMVPDPERLLRESRYADYAESLPR